MTYTPALSRFDIDIERGKTGELFVDDICRMLADKTGQIEVKTDHLYLKTKRFYVEVECRGRDGVWRPSGLRVTTAKLWAFVYGRKTPTEAMLPAVFIIETDWLKRATDLADSLKNNFEHPYGENPTRGIGVTMHHIAKTAPGGPIE
jgi:hypothetical protein